MSNKHHHLSYILTLCLALVAQPAWALDDGDKIPGANRKLAQANPAKPAPQPKLAVAEPVEIEADVLAFVREHHPELADLLAQLKASRPREYQKALRDLSRVRDRLFAMRKNDDQRYDLELAVWKTETRIQLLAARLQMGPSDDLRNQLRHALNEQVELRIAVLKHDRALAEERRNRLDAQIQRLDQDRSQAIEKQLEILAKPSPSPAQPPSQSGKAEPTSSPTKPAVKSDAKAKLVPPVKKS